MDQKQWDCSCHVKYPNISHKHENGSWKCVDKYICVRDYIKGKNYDCCTHCIKKERIEEMESIIENINIIDTLNDQISALLDLLQMANESTDMKSVNTAAEMCMTMQDELMIEIKKIEDKWKEMK